MSLGVLNNLYAIYAENNLNNTSNSLSTVLQQLSSGSKINSGADDAAGLSLVNGLQANSMALAQSQTNASEGVGLLTVADGALSQVTNLLNRAVTLATEASNGTLNSSQDTAANQEYQSILSEITTSARPPPITIRRSSTPTPTSIPATLRRRARRSTPEHPLAVFLQRGRHRRHHGLQQRPNSVFIDLSQRHPERAEHRHAERPWQHDDQCQLSGEGRGRQRDQRIHKHFFEGGASGYQNTASGLISAINNSGLGLSANFSTEAQAGVSGGGTHRTA